MALKIASGPLVLGKGAGLQIAGGFNPTSITGLQAWFKADAITGKNDGDAIAQWNDSSGNARHATQATGANQPLYKTNILNGKPVARFDGTDSLATASFTAITQPTTIFVVASTRTSGTGTQFICDGIGSTNRNAIFEASGAGTMSIFSNAVLASAITGAQPLSIWTALFNNTASDLRKNGTSIVNGTSGAQVLTGVRLGASDTASSNLIGDIAEYLLYVGNVSGSNRTAVERYLSQKYGIAVA